MSARCASCGRSDLMQPDVANYQCLACGALTDIATEQVVIASPPVAKLSNAGLPVVELSTNVVVADADDADRRNRPTEDDVSVHEADTPAEPVEEPVVEETVVSPASEPIDLSTLTPEQLAAVESIIHPGGENE